jgi:hypothetical protein
MLLTLAAAAAALHPADDYAASAVGRFSSEAQHRADAAYDHVEARVVRIWPERGDGVWLYQEQAIVNVPGLTPDAARRKPYFQFVARVTTLAPGVLRRDNFRVKDGAAWLGVTQGDARLARLSPADLAPASCHNRLEKVARGVWIGRTESCANTYKGAAWMQSLSVSSPDAYVNWDRGFDTAGNRVWGPEHGGYVFRRLGK